MARGLSLLLVILVLVGCASAASSREPSRQTSPPRVRCLSDPQRDITEDTRPLFFFFCVESP